MIVRLHVTDADGVLLGVVELDAEDLRHPRAIGTAVLDELPSSLRPSEDELR